jgi:hypothetical protein
MTDAFPGSLALTHTDIQQHYLDRMEQRPVPQTKHGVQPTRMRQQGALRTAPLPILDKRGKIQVATRRDAVRKFQQLLGQVSTIAASTSASSPRLDPWSTTLLLDAYDKADDDEDTEGEETHHARTQTRSASPYHLSLDSLQAVPAADTDTDTDGKEDAQPTAASSESAPDDTSDLFRPAVTPLSPNTLPTPTTTSSPSPPSSSSSAEPKTNGGNATTPPQLPLQLSTYYLDHQKLYANDLSSLFRASDDDNANREEDDAAAEHLMRLHETLAQRYLGLLAPYRGVFLLHELGPNVACASVAVAEAAKSDGRIVVLLTAANKPAFLRHLTRFGDHLYRRRHAWDFVSTDGAPERIRELASALALSEDTVRQRGGAWLVNTARKEPNYALVNADHREEIDRQLDDLLAHKYTVLAYDDANEWRTFLQTTPTAEATPNPFDHSVVLVDDCSRFIDCLVQSQEKERGASAPVPREVYGWLQSAEDTRVVLLTSQRLLLARSPHEMAFAINVMRGYVHTWKFVVSAASPSSSSDNTIEDLLQSSAFAAFDWVQYADHVLTITRNPWGFVQPAPRIGGRTSSNAKPTQRRVKTQRRSRREKRAPAKGGNGTRKRSPLPPNHPAENAPSPALQLNEQGDLAVSTDFPSLVQQLLEAHGFAVDAEQTELTYQKFVTDDPAEFEERFTENHHDNNFLQKRLLGLVHVVEIGEGTEGEGVLPSVVVDDETAGTPPYSRFHVEQIPLTKHQLAEMDRLDDDDTDRPSTQRRAEEQAIGNFSFPSEIARPPLVLETAPPAVDTAADPDDVPPSASGSTLPTPTASANQVADDDDSENHVLLVASRLQQTPTNTLSADDTHDDTQSASEPAAEHTEEPTDDRPDERNPTVEPLSVETAAQQLSELPDRYFGPDALHTIYSPKLARLLEHIVQPEHPGLHLVHSAFGQLEGAGIVRLVLLANGFQELKVAKQGEDWVLQHGGMGIPHFVQCTGAETAEERAVLVNIFNSAWDLLPASLLQSLAKIHRDNVEGAVARVLVTTPAVVAAEGRTFDHVRFLHLLEPADNVAAMERVVASVRHAFSHRRLPSPDWRTVQVFLYVSVFPEGETPTENREAEGEGGVLSTADQSMWKQALTRYEQVDLPLRTQVVQSAIE